MITQRYASQLKNLRGAIKTSDKGTITVQLWDRGEMEQEIVTVVNDKANSTIIKWLEGDNSWSEDVKIGDLVGEREETPVFLRRD